jgi:hypothetical protein
VKRRREWHGPRPATWEVLVDADRRSVVICGRADHAISDARYFVAEGRIAVAVRYELCPVPGCDGRGTVSRRVRGRMFPVESPCPAHVERTEFDEPL